MKKSIKVVLISLIVLFSMTTMTKAASSNEVIDYIERECGEYVTDSDMKIVRDYFKQYPISDKEGNQLKSKIKAVKKILDKGSSNRVRSLTDAEKQQLKDLANEAARIIDVNLVFKSNARVDVYKDGVKIQSFYLSGNNRILAYTGSSTNIIVISGIAIVAIASVAFIVRKKVADAK